MSDLQEVRIPDLGDVDEVDVVEVLVAAGDLVGKDDSLVSLESDKATMDVPAPQAGTVREVKVKAGDKVREGSVILILEPETKSAQKPEARSEAKSEQEAKPEPEPEPESEATPAAEPVSVAPNEESASEVPSREEMQPATPAAAPQAQASDAGATPPVDFARVYASPAVRRLARQLGVDLTRVRGTGRKERILAEDVEKFVKAELASPRGGSQVAVDLPVIDFSTFGTIERQKLTRIQKISGPSLTRSWLTIPHVTQHDEADITELEAFRQDHKAEAKAQGFSLTPLAFVMKAAVASLREFPRVNSSLDADGEHLVVKKYFHIGVAVDTPEGLVVPVIRDVDRKGVFELAAELAEVSVQARERKLKPDQVRGASFTISSLGGIGGTFFTPIVNWPEVAILGVSRSRQAPVWNGEEFEPRLVLPLSFSYDHRVIDGAMAVRFTTHLSGVLSDIRKLVL